MSDDERGRSPDLDQLRQRLFPDLSPDEGQAAIDEALRGQADSERWRGIEERARKADLYGDLLAILYDLRETHVRDPGEPEDGADV